MPKTVETPVLERIDPEQVRPALVRHLPLEFLKGQHAIPLVGADGEVVIALADAQNLEAYDAIVNLLSQVPAHDEWILDQPCARIVCAAEQIDNAISHCYYQDTCTDSAAVSTSEGDEVIESEFFGDLTIQTKAEDLLNITGKAPAIKLVNQLLFGAVQARASDIHIEPYETEARVRFRVDGVLHEVQTIPRAQVPAVESRLKIMANLDIAEHRLPQDGQSRIRIGNCLVDIRVSVIPTLGGERIVLRLLDKGRGQLRLEETGFDAGMLRTLRTLLGLPNGILLLTGPTGSGKTTTLYAALSELNGQERNILTVEDPVEYQLPGIGQMQVKPKIDLTFANCLRHILRQDPDIIMIGEIRDRETAQIAVQASMTGHLVLSTLHTNDAPSAVTRLIDMGVEPYLLSSSLVAVIAQRLVREVCPECRTEEGDAVAQVQPLATARVQVPSDAKIQRGLGCGHCLNTGFFGRTGIFELMVVDDSIRSLITSRSPAPVIRHEAIENGMCTLQEDGLRKVLAGRTTVREVLRVTQDCAMMGGL